MRPPRPSILAAVLFLSPISACDRLPTAGPTVTAVGPRLVSDQTSYPLMLYGTGFVAGMKARIAGVSGTKTVDVDVVEAEHATVRLRLDDVVHPRRSLSRVRIAAAGSGDRGAVLRVVNDSRFPVLEDLEVDPDGRRFLVACSSTDELWILSRDGAAARRVPVGDGPRALARYHDERGRWWLAILHQFAAELWLLPFDDPEATPVRIPVPANPQDVVVDSERHRAYVTSRVTDAAHAIDLRTRRELTTFPVGVNPCRVALGRRGALLLVGNQGSSDESLVELDGRREIRTRPGPGTPIIGGRTERYSRDVLGGTPPRDLAFSDRLGVAFIGSIGPNVGPNRDRMDVSMNGGVGVVDGSGRFLRHVSMVRGVPEGLALDDARGLLYVTDVATGRVVVFDATRLGRDDDAARGALLGAAEIPPPAG